ncbi:MAG: phosphotransferase [Candidatus Eremiobacteraeota bacterium]|nr:phosphotransferase [Candidatus Eremiobacteraeota bacterium]
MLTRRDAVHHLLRLGEIAPAELLNGGVTATEYLGRNHLVLVDVGGARGYVVKQPKVLGSADAATMWTEAALFWMSANEPAFAEIAQVMPRYVHYDEINALLTTERVMQAPPLYAVLANGPQPPPATLHQLGRAFAVLHGSASACLQAERTRRLFRTGPAWVLKLGTPEQAFVPRTDAAKIVLARLMEFPEAAAALARAREAWRDVHVIHGDAKAMNVLVRPDDSVRIIDWELAAVGDGLWDVAGLIHSLLIPRMHVDDLAAAERRARPLLDALWDGYTGGPVELPPGDDPRVTILRLAGTRLVQTCLEGALYRAAIDPMTEGMLRMGLQLMTRPERARERWERAA